MTAPGDNGTGQRRRIRNSALLFGAIALLFYIAFIALAALNA